MKIVQDLTLNGSQASGVMAQRLRNLADLIERTADDMSALGGSPPSIPNGNDLVMGFRLESNV